MVDNLAFRSTEDLNCAEIPSVQDYEEAQKMAKEYNLLGDPKIAGFIAKRNPNTSNLIKSSNLTFSLSQELNTNLDVAFNLNIMNGIFKLSENFNKATKNKYSIIGKISVEFNDKK